MTRVPSTLGTTPRDQSFATTDAINDIDLGTFLEIMIAELQNQDPLNPLDNKDMLAQISQLREVGATDKLTETLESVLLGQNIASATSLIGADIDAVSDDNQRISGTVSRVSLEDGDPKLHLDLGVSAEPSIESGDIEKGTYGYRIVWQNAEGKLEGIELSGADAISTDSSLNNYQSIRLRNLPTTRGPESDLPHRCVRRRATINWSRRSRTDRNRRTWIPWPTNPARKHGRSSRSTPIPGSACGPSKPV